MSNRNDTRPRPEDDLLRVVPDGLTPPATMPTEIFGAALDCYVAEQRLDMQALARQVGMSRATLYRRAGNRDHVLDEVVWWRSRHALVTAVRRHARKRGVNRIVSIIADVLRAIERDPALHAFLDTDPEAALRILTGNRSTVSRGMTAALEGILDLETDRRTFAAGMDTPTLAYAIVRISEGFLYSDIIADRTPDIDKAVQVIEALLHGLDSVRHD